jgi:multiple sugar transport system ATP-binding protein
MSSVALEEVTKRFGDVVAVDNLTLFVDDREFLVLLGPSGCGKSTVLRMVAGLDEPTEGVVRIGDQIVNYGDPKDRDIAMVFQSYALYPQMTVRRNIEFPLKSRHIPRDERRRLVSEVAESLGLQQLLERKPAALSGGQRQRVALARAIVRRPSAFLMDEPLSNLDAKLRVQTRAELIELQERLQATIIYVTHDQVEAMTMGNRIAVVNAGRLQQVGSPQDVYDRPANVFVGGFIGTPPMNMLEGAVKADAGELGLVLPEATLPLPSQLTGMVKSRGLQRIVLGVRPEHLAISPTGLIPGSVAVVEALGYERQIVCRVATDAGTQLAIARQSSEITPPRIGEAVRLSITPNRLHLFDPLSGARMEPTR